MSHNEAWLRLYREKKFFALRSKQKCRIFPTAPSPFLYSWSSPERTAMSGTTQCSSSLSLLVSPDLCYFLPAVPGTEGVVPTFLPSTPSLPSGTLSPLLLLPLETAPAKLRTLLDLTDALLSHPRWILSCCQLTRVLSGQMNPTRAFPLRAVMHLTLKGRGTWCSELLFTNSTSIKGWPIIQPTQYLWSFCFADPIATGQILFTAHNYYPMVA